MAYMKARPARVGLLLTCLCLLALALASPTAAQEPQRRTAVADGVATAAKAAAVPTGITPLIGDFDGNDHADLLWYGPGPSPDVLWYGKTDGAFSGSAVNVAGTYEPLLGDFNGDGNNDIFWYGPGADNDVLWYGKAS